MQKQVTLLNGSSMPGIGFGVWRLDDPDLCRASILSALEAGYRHIDTAAFYKNEAAVGKAVRESGIPRDELFITTKIWKLDIREDRCADAFSESMDRLDIGPLDLLLVHWPVPGKVQSGWEAMEAILAGGTVKNIGVSNHRILDLDEILAMGGTVPAVNQLEIHPYFPQNELVAYCAGRRIQVQAWSPLGAQKAPLLEEPVLKEVGAQYGKTPAQVCLRWNIQRGIVPLPKSANPGRQRENLDIFDFSLTPSDMEKIASLDCARRLGPDPDAFGAQP